ncbi:quinon protein alcohol dehydrogenase-like superfamily [Suillus subalutaceus]|uniref:quinon protein alcohol dehydrogenase-like superfamily n=1 Tax=Suillus subalutaceus TaxID=48586 RepID=UPI001B875406|nr:quinon protein alcohol dehydrogenase-like superfamily [Suillus subalutaceus]KAG1853185.1 quinon protein alcohol dehydrogenase-like superfamily [Suillus subalutaceus]
MRLWNVNTGKVIKTWTGHATEVQSVCWSSDGKRVVSGSNLKDGTCRVWDIERGETIIRPITGRAGRFVWAVCYSPDGKMIATSEDDLKIWDANSGELLKTIERFFTCLAWTSDGKMLIAGGSGITKFNTATWTVVDMRENLAFHYLPMTKLWDLETNQPIKTPLHHEDYVRSATFSADGKFLVTSCINNVHYTWDLSAIVNCNEAGLPSDIADATPKATPKIKGARRIPPGFFDDALREANLRIRLSQTHGPHDHTTPASRQRTLSRFSFFLRRSRPHGATERDTQIRSRPFSWTRNIVSSILRRRDGSDIQLHEVEVPCTAGKPRNYHARKKPATSSSRPSNTHAMQQHSAATQSISPSSQQSSPAAITSTLSAVPDTARAAGTTSRPRITIDSGWCTRLMLWQIITYSWDGSFRVWNLEKGTQVGEEWEDKERRVVVMALSPSGKTVTTGNVDGAVKLWNVNMGKIIKTWIGHTERVMSMCWSSDGGRVVSGFDDETFKVWDVKSGQTILGPIKTGEEVWAVCYSPDGTKIATGFNDLKIWDANTGELLKTLDISGFCLAWTLDERTLIARGRKLNTTTWTETANLQLYGGIDTISLSPNGRILASTSDVTLTAVVQCNYGTSKPISPSERHSTMKTR